MRNSWARAWLAATLLLFAASAMAKNRHDTLLRVEEPVMEWLLDGTDTTGWERVAFLGSPWLILPGTILLVIVSGIFDRRVGASVIITSALGSIIAIVTRNIVDRAGPLDDAATGSFPSLEVAQTGTFWGLVVLTAWWLGAPKLVWQVMLELSIVATILVSINLIVSGQHWPSDAIGSIIVVAVALIFASICFEAFARPRDRMTSEHVPEHAAVTG